MALRTLLGRVAGPGITNPTASRRLSGGASLVSPPPLPLLPTVHQGLSFRARFRCASAPSHHSPHDDSRGSSRGSGSPMEPSPTSAASHSPAADSEHVGVNDPSATGGDVEQQHHEGTAHHVLHHHTAEEKNKAAFERFGKPFNELDTNQKKAVGGMLGGQTRREQLGHEGYVEMGHTGGEARKEQLGHEGYVEMGHKGGEARKEQLSHEGYVDMGHKSGEARRERHRQEDSSE